MAAARLKQPNVFTRGRPPGDEDAVSRIERAREATAISKAQRLQASKDVLMGVLGKLELPLRMLAQGDEIQSPRLGAGYLLLEGGVPQDGRTAVLDHLQQLARVKPSGRLQSLDTIQALLYMHDTDSLCLLFVRTWVVRLFRGRESTRGDIFIWLGVFLCGVAVEPALGLVLLTGGMSLLFRKSLLRLVAMWQPMCLYLVCSDGVWI